MKGAWLNKLKKTRIFKFVHFLTYFLTERTINKPQRTKRALTILMLVLILSVFSGLTFQISRALSNSFGNSAFLNSISIIGNVNACWGEDFTNKVSEVNWGVLSPGSSKSIAIYIRNEGNTPVTLSLAATNWNPPVCSSYMTLSWNFNGQKLNVGEYIKVIVTLSVARDITEIADFSFQTVIQAEE